jgi:hypothetical protein
MSEPVSITGGATEMGFSITQPPVKAAASALRAA